MELVRMGDTNVEAYEAAMGGIRDSLGKTSPLAVEGDGLGLHERQLKKISPEKETFALRGSLDSSCINATAVSLSLDPALLAPSKNRSGVRPTNSRDNPPYEETSKRTRFCTICRLPGHKSTTCPDRVPGEAKPRKRSAQIAV